MKVMDNPVEAMKDDVPKIKIHAGFYNYLYSRPTSQGEDQLYLPPTKCEIILDQVIKLLREHPGYRLYSTGHSLGAALSTVFAFEAACLSRRDIPKPVTCINFASPKVGNLHFRKAFAYLERKGAIQLVRVVNYFDPVPRVPLRAYSNDFYFLCRLSNTYTHVGFKIEMKKGRKLRVAHTRFFDSWWAYFCFVAKNYIRLIFHVAYLCTGGYLGIKVLRYHSCLKYYTLVRANEDDLQNLNLDDMCDTIMQGNLRKTWIRNEEE